MITLTTEGANALLETVFTGEDIFLCLASDADLTEITDPAYSRVELTTVLGEPVDGIVTNDTAITFDAGDESAAWWFAARVSGETVTPLAYGPMPSVTTGEMTFSVGAITFTAIAG